MVDLFEDKFRSIQRLFNLIFQIRTNFSSRNVISLITLGLLDFTQLEAQPHKIIEIYLSKNYFLFNQTVGLPEIKLSE